MKDYIKPTFIIAGLTPLSLSSGGCSIDEEGKALLDDMHGALDWSKAFASEGDGCSQVVASFDRFCKFTSEGIANPVVVIGS